MWRSPVTSTVALSPTIDSVWIRPDVPRCFGVSALIWPISGYSIETRAVRSSTENYSVQRNLFFAPLGFEHHASSS